MAMVAAGFVCIGLPRRRTKSIRVYQGVTTDCRYRARGKASEIEIETLRAEKSLAGVVEGEPIQTVKQMTAKSWRGDRGLTYSLQ